MTVHGHEVVVISSSNNTEIWEVFPDVRGGTVVRVDSGSGRVVGAAVLRLNQAISYRDGAKYNGDPENVNDFIAVYNFLVRIPAGLPRYGVTIGTGHGTVWFSAAEMREGPVLTLGSLGLMLSAIPVSCPAGTVRYPCAESAGGRSLFMGSG